ncbi:hypothetical protein C8J57DRAFT_1143922, partial [Mycena rebaudengoi]
MDPEDDASSNPEPIDHASAAKLWAVYVSEAEKYDKALVESWKSDMNGMLIFAGLFSASLTAFLIESYKTLLPDPGEDTVLLLRQISNQLSANTNGSSLAVAELIPFSPPATSLICNIFWFISLGLSLACALIATLLEQWARDFIHKSEMRSSPLIRARIFAFLYYGLKRFNMHTVVEVIPLLLHASLILFFAGLVVFLIPVNPIIMALVSFLLIIVIAVYSLLTILPLKYLDSPYRTPLSTAFWNLFHSLSQRLWRHDYDIPAETMVEAMSRAATTPSLERKARDDRALAWTVKSLADETELEPFVEAIAEVLCDSEGIRRGYRRRVRKLVDNPDLRFCARIEELRASCDAGLLSAAEKTRRQTACYRALWAIAALTKSGSDAGTILERHPPILFN